MGSRRGAARSGGMGRGPVLGFLLRFALYLAAGTLLLSLPWVEARFVEPWTRVNASGAAALARGVGVNARAEGTIVSYGSGTLSILNGCNGVEALLTLLAALLAFPASWARRLLGVLAGTLAVLGANLVRLVSLLFVARYFPDWLETFHVYVWQALIVLITFGVFLCWGVFVARVGVATRPAGGS